MSTLIIRLFGSLEIERTGERVALPQSKKTRALLAYLILKGQPQRRDSLCELLWDVPDDPRAALRWSLSKLRPIVNDDGYERLAADRERVTFTAQGAGIDMLHLEQAYISGFTGKPTSELLELLALCQGQPLAGLDLPSHPDYEAWRVGQQNRASELRLRLLDEALRRSDLDPLKASELLRLRSELDPADTESHARLIAHLAASGRNNEAKAQAEASHRLLASLGPYDRGVLTAALEGRGTQPPRQAVALVDPIKPARLRQLIHFCKTDDGVNIAYAVSGSGPPLVKTANWMNHLEFDWQSPVWRHMFSALSEMRTLIRYDARGNGLSDWNVEGLNLNAFVNDLKAVVDAAGIERFPLFGLSQGCAVSVEFAARWPNRVSKLILFGGFARGWRLRGGERFRQQGEALMALTRMGWGRNNPAFRQVYTSMFFPGGTQEELNWFNELQKVTTSPDNAAAIIEAFGDIDVSARLPHLNVPTLVIHARGDELVPYKAGREMATAIPNAKFVTLESPNHLILEHEPAWPLFLSEIRSFLDD